MTMLLGALSHSYTHFKNTSLRLPSRYDGLLNGVYNDEVALMVIGWLLYQGL